MECTVSSVMEEGIVEMKGYRGELLISEIPQDAEVRTDISIDPISLIGDDDITKTTLKLKVGHILHHFRQ